MPSSYLQSSSNMFTRLAFNIFFTLKWTTHYITDLQFFSDMLFSLSFIFTANFKAGLVYWFWQIFAELIFCRDPSQLRGEILTTRIVKGVKGLGFTLIGNDGSSLYEEFLQVNISWFYLFQIVQFKLFAKLLSGKQICEWTIVYYK